MNSRLERMENWPAVAQTVGYHASGLAAHFNVCLRQLERVFHVKLGTSPHKWLRELRMKRAVQLLQEKQPVKIIAPELGYKYPAHFARDFKNYFGVPPSEHHLTFGLPPTESLPIKL